MLVIKKFIKFINLKFYLILIIPVNYSKNIFYKFRIRYLDIPNLQYKPRFSIIIPVYNIDEQILLECIDSIRSQYYTDYEICIYDDASSNSSTLNALNKIKSYNLNLKLKMGSVNLGISGAMNEAVSISNYDYLIFVDNDDRIPRNCLYEVAKFINQHPNGKFFYTDENKIDFNNIYNQENFKPDFSPELLYNLNYVLHLLIVEKQTFLKLGKLDPNYSGAQDYDLVLKALRENIKIYHIPGILYHWRMVKGSASADVDAKPVALINGKKALQNHFDSVTPNKFQIMHGFLPGTFRPRLKKYDFGSLSILIPTHGITRNLAKGVNIHLSKNLIESIYNNSTFQNFEIILLEDHNSVEKLDSRLFDKRLKIIEYKLPDNEKFNFSKKVNYGIKAINNDIIILLNDDMEIISEDWIESLLDVLEMPNIGVVGGKLLYENNKIQHAGIILEPKNIAVHVCHNQNSDELGYNGFTHLIRNYLAVTGACLAFRRKDAFDWGLFNEDLSTDFNDVDFCLKSYRSGKRNVYTPYCQLYHYEQSSIPRNSRSNLEQEIFKSNWMNLILNDPYSNKYKKIF
jgi:GT2 family glycosyltransferase